MDRIAQAPQQERAELFRRSAGILPRSARQRSSRRIFGSARRMRRLFDVLQFRPQL